MAKEVKYRIVERIFVDDVRIFYVPEKQEKIMFFNHWFDFTYKVFPTIEEAEAAIYDDIKSLKSGNVTKVVKEITKIVE